MTTRRKSFRQPGSHTAGHQERPLALAARAVMAPEAAATLSWWRYVRAEGISAEPVRCEAGELLNSAN